MSSDIIVSYHDSVLRETDLDILKSDGWLTDSIIGFYMQYLEKEVYFDKPLLFISPEVTHCLKSCQDTTDLKIFLDPLSPKKHSLIFLPLNNNENINSVGGSHWSLLIYHLHSNSYFHLDSSSGMNGKQACNFARKLSTYFSKVPGKYEELSTLQQDNSYDCGIYLLCNVENAANYWLEHKTLNSLSSIQMCDVREKRSNILKIVNAINKESFRRK